MVRLFRPHQQTWPQKDLNHARRFREPERLVESGNDPQNNSLTALFSVHHKLSVKLLPFCQSSLLSVERIVTTVVSDFDIQYVVG